MPNPGAMEFAGTILNFCKVSSALAFLLPATAHT